MSPIRVPAWLLVAVVLDYLWCGTSAQEYSYEYSRSISSESYSAAPSDKNPCSFRGQFWLHKESFRIDPCIVCSCNNGTTTCEVESCPVKAGCPHSEIVIIPEECCPQCPYTMSYFDELEDRLRITFENLSTEEVGEAVKVVVEATENPEFFRDDPERVELVIESLESVVGVGDASVNVTDQVVQIVNNLMDVDEDIIADGTRQGGRVIAALEAQVANVQTNEGNFTRIFENIGVIAVKIDKEALGSSLAFANVFTDNGTPMLGEDLRDNTAMLFGDERDIPVNRITSSIAVPTSVIDVLENAGVEVTEVPVSFFIYGNSVLFTPSRPTLTPEDGEDDTNTTEVVVSQVISVIIETEGISITKLPTGSPNVTVKFTTNVDLGDNETIVAKDGVFWDYDSRTGNGFWSTEGCRVRGEELGRTVFSSNRLANFAILVRVRKGTRENVVALNFITVIGSIISGICLVLCLITFASLKAFWSKQPTYIHINLCLSLLGFYTLFLLSSLAIGDKILCPIASVGIHFSCLATVAWMSVEAVNLYYLFVMNKKKAIPYFIPVACLLAYGSSAVCALLVALLDRDSPFPNTDYCFIHPGPALYFGFLAEVAILFLLNMIIFTLVVRRALCRPIMASSTRENARRNEIITRVRHGIFFWFVLGLSWFFGFLAAIDATTSIFDYLYCICIAIQGLVMFLLLCVVNPEFRKVFARTGRDASQTRGGGRLAASKDTPMSKLNDDSQADSQMVTQMAILNN